MRTGDIAAGDRREYTIAETAAETKRIMKIIISTSENIR
jgi:hypothetical protein